MNMECNTPIDKKTLIECPKDFKGEYVIPDYVTWISNHAFYGCIGLTSITIPDSVTEIGGNPFFNCGGLTKIIVPKGEKDRFVRMAALEDFKDIVVEKE